MNFLALVLARIFESETRDPSGSFFGDDLDAFDHSWDNFVFDAGVKAFRIFAHHDQVDAGVACGNMRQVADGPEICEEFKALPQFHVDARKAAANGGSHGALEADARALDRFGKFFRNVFLVLFKSFGASREAFPFEFDAGCFEHANRSLDDFRTDSIAGD